MEKIDVKRVQDTLLKMAKTISAILESNDIPYMIAYGTLLGAVRHKGFIPWDDDFDFYLFDDSYERAIEILRLNLPENMFLEDEKSEPLYFHSWVHVKDLNSIVCCKEYPQDSLYEHKGLCVDLFRTKCMPLSELETFLCKENEKYIEKRKTKRLIDASELEERIKKLDEQKQFIKSHKENSHEMIYNLIPTYKCHYMKAADVFPLKKYVFEDTEFWGPSEGENILTSIYNQYMELPEFDKRRCHYSSVQFLY